MKHHKDEVHYSDGMLHSHCGPTFHDDRYYCKHFIPKTSRVGECDVVTGAILPEMWCELFKKTSRSS